GEAAIELYAGHRQPPEIGQARVAYAEVVQVDIHAAFRQPIDHAPGRLEAVDEQRLGNLDLQQRWRDAVGGKGGVDDLEEIRGFDLTDRGVDRDRHRLQAFVEPLPDLPADCPQDPGAEPNDLARFFGKRNELHRRNGPELRVHPAAQGLES